MLTDEDINKLKVVFATKDDFKNLATKDDVKTLISESEDRMLQVLVTKAELRELKEDIGYLRELVQGLIVSSESLAKAVSDLTLEYAAVKMQLSRHDAWIKQIAEKIGLQLSTE
jgi:hypothetical protein